MGSFTALHRKRNRYFKLIHRAQPSGCALFGWNNGGSSCRPFSAQEAFRIAVERISVGTGTVTFPFFTATGHSALVKQVARVLTCAVLLYSDQA